jgi:hypothetical protein
MDLARLMKTFHWRFRRFFALIFLPNLIPGFFLVSAKQGSYRQVAAHCCVIMLAGA